MHLSALDGISIHALLAESDISSRRASCSSVEYFYPRSPCGERRAGAVAHREGEQFLSTLSLRRATRKIHNFDKNCLYFYPRSPCGERPTCPWPTCPGPRFLSTLSLRRATKTRNLQKPNRRFLSTLSLRRATRGGGTIECQRNDFYPRSPCGERQADYRDTSFTKWISIHALLAESDTMFPCFIIIYIKISIHALLAESDNLTDLRHWQVGQFLSTLSLRRATISARRDASESIDFYPRSPCGERLGGRIRQGDKLQFLSTLSLRRATPLRLRDIVAATISIHALLAESDICSAAFCSLPALFLSTLSLRRATRSFPLRPSRR